MRKLITALAFLAIALPVLAGKELPVTVVKVDTVPAGAQVSCNGKPQGAAPVLISGLMPGKHLLIAEKDGYRAARQVINVTTGEKLAVGMELERNSTLVLIHTEPEGAEVTIGGASQGKTPLLLTDLPPGKHRVKLEAQGFQPKEVDLNAPNRTPVKLSVSLSSDSAKLTISSRPADAEILINGISKGDTPMTVERIQAGNVNLELRKEGCKPYKQLLTLAAGQEETITAVLEEMPSTLVVNSIPDGARIYVDNEFRGETPLNLTDLKPGTYRVRAEKRGYSLTPSRSITLDRAQTIREEFRLSKNAGSLEITTQPAGIKVFVDGEELGTTKAKEDESDAVSEPLVINLLGIGDHKVQLTRPGYFKKEFDITIEKNATVSAHHRLRRMFIKNYQVRTRDATYEGMLLGKTLTGGVKIEIRPGIVKTLSAGDILSQAPIRQDQIDSPE